MQTFCHHNSYLLPNNHGYYREESVVLGDLPSRFRESVVNGTPDTSLCNEMLVLYSSVASAGEKLRDSANLSLLQREISPWINAFYTTGMAGIDGVRALLSDSLQERMDIFFRMVEKLASIKKLRRDAWVNGKVEQVEDIQVGAYAITPTVLATYNYLNASIYSDISGGDFRALMPTFSTNMGNENENIANISDNDFNTYWLSARNQEEGDWFCLDFGRPMPVKTVKMLLADRVRPRHYPVRGQMEYSTDGQTWTAVGEENKVVEHLLNVCYEVSCDYNRRLTVVVVYYRAQNILSCRRVNACYRLVKKIQLRSSRHYENELDLFLGAL
jgi:hyaluronoglucosaminidase